MSKQYVIGIDGGGTKTEAAIAYRSGTGEVEIVKYLRGESTNPHAVSYEKSLHNLKQLLDDARNELIAVNGICSAVCIGLSGVDREEEKLKYIEFMNQYAKETDSSFTVNITNDAEIALMAALRRNNGMIAISGTGSIMYGITPDGAKYRTGGWGHLLGDEGSGYDIGLNTLKAAMRSYDGVYGPTFLTEYIIQAYSFHDLSDLKSYIYNEKIQKQDIAKFAELCIRAAEEQDQIAVQIIEQAAGGLAKAALALIRKNVWFESSSIVLTGSIFKHSGHYTEKFKHDVTQTYSNVQMTIAERPSADGAAFLALKEVDSRL